MELGLIELLLVLGFALGLGAWELASLRRDKRRAAKAERNATAGESAPRARRPEGQQQPDPR